MHKGIFKTYSLLEIEVSDTEASVLTDSNIISAHSAEVSREGREILIVFI
jgi:hypothetical protein